jgi:hypothetical protein
MTRNELAVDMLKASRENRELHRQAQKCIGDHHQSEEWQGCHPETNIYSQMWCAPK